jgi:5-(carboxyamino)imidazole ribonucleotide synthase
MSTPIMPGSVLGVLGGGQLGRMFTLAARRMGYRVNVFAPEDDTPAGQIAYREIRAPYHDLEAVRAFAQEVDVVTFEFENIPVAATEEAARWAPVRPSGSLLHVTQERSREKQALQGNGIPVAPFAVIEDPGDIASAAEDIGFPAILKTSSWGYDGRGQRRVENRSDLEAAFAELGGVPTVLEGFIDFACEISVVGARGLDGQVVVYEPFLNHHHNHILDWTVCPAPIQPGVRDRALEIARQVLDCFDVVGVLCVEFFVKSDGELLVNELAPRPHNSGHITIDAHETCQFEQQVRAVCGLPLGSIQRTVPAAAMVNLLGDSWQHGPPDWAAALAEPNLHLHLYGKANARAGRKMGHLVVTSDQVESAKARALCARDALQSKGIVA